MFRKYYGVKDFNYPYNLRRFSQNGYNIIQGAEDTV